MARGLRKSADEHSPFLHSKFANMKKKGQWVLLPYLAAQRPPGLRLVSPGVKVERDRQPLWLGDYSFNKLNSETLPLTNVELIQYGPAL